MYGSKSPESTVIPINSAPLPDVLLKATVAAPLNIPCIPLIFVLPANTIPA